MYIKATVKADAHRDSVTLRNDRYQVTTCAKAVGGQANEAARALLAAHLGIPLSSLSLIRGKDRPAKLFMRR